MIRGLIKKLIFLVLIAGIVYGVYWMINKDGAIEIKNKIVSIFQRNKTIDNLIKNDGEIIEDVVVLDEITVNSGIVFSGSDNSGDYSGDNSFEELLDAVMSLDDDSNTGVNDNFVPASTTTGTTETTSTINTKTTQTIKTTTPKTTVTTVKKTTTSTSNNQDILNTLFK